MEMRFFAGEKTSCGPRPGESFQGIKWIPLVRVCQHVNGETYLRFVREVEVVLVRLDLVEPVLALFRIVPSYSATNFPDDVGPRLHLL